MRNILVILPLAFTSLIAIADEQPIAKLEALPSELKQIIINSITQANTITEAVKSLRALAITNRAFSKAVSDPITTQALINLLLKRFPNETLENPIIAAVALGTKGARDWLNINHPNWLQDIGGILKDEFRNLGQVDQVQALPSLVEALMLNSKTIDLVKNYKDKYNRTVLHAAAANNRLSLVKALLAAKADPNVKDKYNETALYLAAYEGHNDVVKTLLDAKADPNIEDKYGNTALHMAARGGHDDIIKTLLAADVDPNIKNANKEAALHWAAVNGRNNVVKTLLAAKADPDIKSPYKGTALHRAAGRDYSDVVKTLLDAKADPNIEDDLNRTPLDIARERGHKDTVEVIEKYTAKSSK